jgi:hypothetical protein
MPCSKCGCINESDAAHCALCGNALIRSDPDPRVLREVADSIHPDEPAAWHRCMPSGAWCWLAGALLGFLLMKVPVLNFMGWFMGALFHELGHCGAAWLTGCWALPAVGIQGHAMAVHGEQKLGLGILLLLLTSAGCACLWWQGWRKTALLATILVLLQGTAVFFSAVRDPLILAAGHLGELVFAAVFLWRAWTGEFVESPIERPVYAAFGFCILFENLRLFLGLMISSGARLVYHGNGSFGLENDLIRIARDHLGIPLEVTTVFFFIAAVATLPLAWLMARNR